MGPLLDVMRSCNVALRWRLLHRTRKHVARGDDGVDAEKLITLLLKTSQLEYKLKQMFQSLLDTKSEKWEFCKKQARARRARGACARAGRLRRRAAGGSFMYIYIYIHIISMHVNISQL